MAVQQIPITGYRTRFPLLLPLHVTNTFATAADVFTEQTEDTMAAYVYAQRQISILPAEWLSLKIIQLFFYSALARGNAAAQSKPESITPRLVKASLPYFPANLANEKLSSELILLLFDRAASLAAWSKNSAIAHLPPVLDARDFENVMPLTEIWQTLARVSGKGVFPGNDTTSLADILSEPARLYPRSLLQQAEFILKERASIFLPEFASSTSFALNILSMARVSRKTLGGPNGHDVAPPAELESYEGHTNYRPDRHWMSEIVIQAKSAYVWLFQLSQKYDRPVHTLGDIPDEELESLARAGFRGLWLIGLWERSGASRVIKQRKGNPEAEASAYAVERYEIASRLGGEAALTRLHEKCDRLGLRLCADMVPNHMGLDSDYVRNYPDLFMQTGYAPFAGYNYANEPVYEDEYRRIHIENGYFSETDAAVTYLLHEKNTGRDRFIYHGNDGTRMPWNDTAQFDFIKHETREFVKNLIRSVASRFSIIRFDAAMVLTRKHIRRLWYPHAHKVHEVIASREYHTMSDEEFHRLMPEEFWSEVTAMVAHEFPDTLLIAEAFWLLEKYFVRHLGMHRVYHSAFMHFLHKEQNQKFRAYLKEILSHEPEMLRRFVHFLSNPDEEPAAETFGTGDKYFAAATLLLTIPGLPLWAHGQTYGYHEKYGMEYSRSYQNEQPDEHLVRRHENELFPLMRKRAQFAGVQNMTLTDFVSEWGHVNEDVYAIANHMHDHNSLILVNNSPSETRGRINFFHAWKNFELGSEYILYENFLLRKTFLRKRHTVFSNDYLFTLSGYGRQIFLDFRNSPYSSAENILLESSVSAHGCDNIELELENLKLSENIQYLYKIAASQLAAMADRSAGEKKSAVKASTPKGPKVSKRKSATPAQNPDKADFSNEANSLFRNFIRHSGMKIRRHGGKPEKLSVVLSQSDVIYAGLLLSREMIENPERPFAEMKPEQLLAVLIAKWYNEADIFQHLPEYSLVAQSLQTGISLSAEYFGSQTFYALSGGHEYKEVKYLVGENLLFMRKLILLQLLARTTKLTAKQVNEKLALFDFYYDSIIKNGYDFEKFLATLE